jgi:hypothetical protein
LAQGAAASSDRLPHGAAQREGVQPGRAGLRHILVNGAVTFGSNDCMGALPGKLLRSYDMID